MNPVIIGNATLHLGDCISTMAGMPDNSIEACLTDPPYGLSQHSEADIRKCMTAWLAGDSYEHGKAGFMSARWDSFVPGPEMWKELYRVLKPGAHLLVFAGTRTSDLMGMALRLAGFEFRDQIMWTFSSGFPKSLDVSAAIDKMKGAEREVVGIAGKSGITRQCMAGDFAGGEYMITSPATPEAAQWDGWKSALKPAYEPILLFRKPLDGTIAETVLKWGCGGLNVDSCRIGEKTETHASKPRHDRNGFVDGFVGGTVTQAHNHGRFPANIILDSSEEVEKCFPVTSSGKPCGVKKASSSIYGKFRTGIEITGFGDTGSASRFFQHCDYSVEEIAEMNEIELKRIVYCAKASKKDRNEGCESIGAKQYSHDGREKPIENAFQRNESVSSNNHSTVKPSSLLRYLLKMICPPGSAVIDPFFGSGSTGKAALLEGFKVVGIEREPEYFEIAKARCAHVSPEIIEVKHERVKTANYQPSLF